MAAALLQLVAAVGVAVAAGRPFDPPKPGRLAGLAAAVVLGGLVAPPSEAEVAAPPSEAEVAAAVLGHLGLTGPRSPVAAFAVELPLTR